MEDAKERKTNWDIQCGHYKFLYVAETIIFIVLFRLKTLAQMYHARSSIPSTFQQRLLEGIHIGN